MRDRAACARLGAALAAERERQGLTQAAFAKACGLDRSHVSLIERGRREPRIGTVARLAGALGVSWEWVYEKYDGAAEDA